MTTGRDIQLKIDGVSYAMFSLDWTQNSYDMYGVLGTESELPVSADEVDCIVTTGSNETHQIWTNFTTKKITDNRYSFTARRFITDEQMKRANVIIDAAHRSLHVPEVNYLNITRETVNGTVSDTVGK